jgi:5,10-methylenetetrahydrofolate reductase
LGGSTRDRSISVAARVKLELWIAMLLFEIGYIAGVRPSVSELVEAVVENVLALRGDPPKGYAKCVPLTEDFRS